MANGGLDLSELGALVAAERSRRGLSLREAAADVGMPFNTLARVEKGHVPDLPKFKRLVDWCGADIASVLRRSCAGYRYPGRHRGAPAGRSQPGAGRS